MKYNYHKLRREDQWTIITLITLAKAKMAHKHPQDIDITLTVEGIELDILKFVGSFKEQMNRRVNEEARDLVESLDTGLIDAIDAAKEVLLDRLRR